MQLCVIGHDGYTNWLEMRRGQLFSDGDIHGGKKRSRREKLVPAWRSTGGAPDTQYAWRRRPREYRGGKPAVSQARESSPGDETQGSKSCRLALTV